MTYAITTRNLNYRAGKNFSITDLSLNVPTGGIYGFLGPNGSGKTTTVRLLLGLLRAHSGAITVLGHKVPAESTAVLEDTGYVPETPHLYTSLTIDEAIRLHAAFHKRWDAKWAKVLMDVFQLPASRQIRALSKGEIAKVMSLLALAQRPRLLMLDEPTDGLDPVVRRDLLSAILDYVAREGATVFISSHLIHELERICDWVGVMDRGRLIAETRMQEFKDGIKRLRVSNTTALRGTPPFVLLGRHAGNGVYDGAEQWLVQGWRDEMSEYFTRGHASLRAVQDLDLEEGFVELLRSFRQPASSRELTGASANQYVNGFPATTHIGITHEAD